MGQVPQYLLIGNGRIARHFQHYFSLQRLPFFSWHRHESLQKLQQQANKSSHILILINDNAVDEFVAMYLKDIPALCIHFSGALISNHVFGAHPLMTFTEKLYDLEQYQSFPFILDHDAPEFEHLLPGLSNRHVRLHKSLKAKYHALCVLSGNFSCLLWQKLFASLEHELNLPVSIAYPYLLQQTKNLLCNPQSALTGPLVRQDTVTIEKNLTALDLDPFQDVYKSFVSCYLKIQAEQKKN